MEVNSMDKNKKKRREKKLRCTFVAKNERAKATHGMKKKAYVYSELFCTECVHGAL